MGVTSRNDRSYTVTPYQESWKEDFVTVRDLLGRIFGDEALSIEHVGSTAIAGMTGKPTIDVLITVRSIHDVDAFNQAMEHIGYEALGEYVAKGGRLFAHEEQGKRLVNVHCFEAGHPHARQMRVMRDYLLAHPLVAQEYASLKMELFERYPDDYVAYRAVKDPYLKALQQQAYAWHEVCTQD